MPNGPSDQLAELLAAPLEHLLTALGAGIGRAQAELDRHSIETQRRISEDPVLGQLGLEATWYQLPRTELELKIAIAMEQPAAGPPARPPEGPQPPPGRPAGGLGEELVAGVLRPAVPRLWIQPVNPRVQNQFSYDVRAASTVSLSIVPVPPPGPAAAGRPTLTAEQALAAARPQLFPKDDLAKPPEDRVTVNFNAIAGMWYVLQTREADQRVELRALVRVDDATGQIASSKSEPPS